MTDRIAKANACGPSWQPGTNEDKARGVMTSVSEAVPLNAAAAQPPARERFWYPYLLIAPSMLTLTVVSLYQEFLLFLLPIINTRSLRRRVVRTVSSFKWVDILPPQIRPKGASNNQDMLTKRGRYYLLPENECALRRRR